MTSKIRFKLSITKEMLLFRSCFVLSREYDRNNVRFQGDMRAQQEMYDLFLCSLSYNILMETLLHL